MPDRIDFLNNPQVNFFGAFYPVGYAVLAFQERADADKVKQLWASGGQIDTDATIIPAMELVDAEGGRASEVDGIAAAIDGETKIMTKHQELAKAGATFLMVFAPDDDTTDKLAQMLTAFKPLTADKYERLVIRGL